MPPPPTDILAVLGLVGAFLFWPAGLVLSILGLNRTKDSADRIGHGLALAGVICSGVIGGLSVLYVVTWLISIAAMFGVLIPLISSLPSATPTF